MQPLRYLALSVILVTPACDADSSSNTSSVGGSWSSAFNGGSSNADSPTGGSLNGNSPVGGSSNGNGTGAILPHNEGTVEVLVSNSSIASAGYACSASHSLLWGAAAPNAATQGSAWVNGQNGHKVSCSVDGSGAYTFTGKISDDVSSFSISGSIGEAGTGTAQVYMFDSFRDLGVPIGDSDCTVSATGNFKVEQGAIWASFDCPHMTSSDDMYLWCNASGMFVFKSCEGQ